MKKGINTIKMSNPAGDAPNLDFIGISKTMVSSSDNNTEENPDEPGEKDSVGQNPADMSQENSDHSEKQKIEGALPTGDTSPMWYVLLAAGSSSVLLGRQMRRRKNK